MASLESYVRQVCVNCGYVSPMMSPDSASVELHMCLRCWGFGARVDTPIMFSDHNVESVMQSEPRADDDSASESEANR